MNKSCLLLIFSIFSLIHLQAENVGDGCNSQMKIEEMYFAPNQGIENSNGSMVSYSNVKSVGSIIVKTGKGIVKSLFLNFMIQDCKGNVSFIPVSAYLNSKTGEYEFIISIPSSKECPSKILDINLGLINECGDTSRFQAALHKTHPTGLRLGISKGWEKSGPSTSNPCSGDFSLKNYQLITATGFSTDGYKLVFATGNNGAVPATVSLIVKLINCKGEVQYINSSMKYDANTGEWISSGTIPAAKDCPWQIAALQSIITDICGNKWTFYSQVEQKSGNKTPKNGRWDEDYKDGKTPSYW